MGLRSNQALFGDSHIICATVDLAIIFRQERLNVIGFVVGWASTFLFGSPAEYLLTKTLELRGEGWLHVDTSSTSPCSMNCVGPLM